MTTKSRRTASARRLAQIAASLTTVFDALEVAINGYVEDIQTIARHGFDRATEAALTGSHIEAIIAAVALQRTVGTEIMAQRRGGLATV